MLRNWLARLLGPAPAAPMAAAQPAILDQYVRTLPSPQNALDIFRGEWHSRLPEPHAGLTAGQLGLFEDPRITWALEKLGGAAGRNVLELGPMEAGHTYMLAKAGAAAITAIEANSRCYLKCLIIQDIFDLRMAHFLCGDFEAYLRANPPRFDLVIGSGVLYHMRNPVELIANLARVTDRLFLWTHYYDPAVMAVAPHIGRISQSQPAEYGGFRHTQHRYEYGNLLDTYRFVGGSAEYSHWLSRDDLLGALRHFGFSQQEITMEDKQHPNGAALCVAAQRGS